MASTTHSFTWARSTIPAFINRSSFFFYAALILFFGFDLVPNPFSCADWIFNVGGMAFIFLTDWLLSRFITGYEEQGTVIVDATEMRLLSKSGRQEHRLLFNNMHSLQVNEGIPRSIFHFISPKRTVVIEIVFLDRTVMKFECVKRSKDGKRITIDSCIPR